MRWYALIMAHLVFATACGSNVFKPIEKKDAAEDATILLEKGKADDAISILTSALEDDPSNYQLTSLLSAAYAQKHGIDTISLALKMGTSSSESSGSQTNELTALFSVLPDASDENFTGLQTAIDLLLSIPEDSRTKADNFKLTMLLTSVTALRTKAFDKDGDGQVSPVEMLTLSEEDALAILSNLDTAAAVLAGVDTSSAGTAAAATSITALQEKIASQPGDSNAERLQAYLGGGSGA